jgi:hypothetical protein
LYDARAVGEPRSRWTLLAEDGLFMPDFRRLLVVEFVFCQVRHIAVVPKSHFSSFEFASGVCLRDGHLLKKSVSIEYGVCYLEGLLE